MILLLLLLLIILALLIVIINTATALICDFGGGRVRWVWHILIPRYNAIILGVAPDTRPRRHRFLSVEIAWRVSCSVWQEPASISHGGDRGRVLRGGRVGGDGADCTVIVF